MVVEQLYLVFEFLDLDLKKYMDQIPTDGTGLGPDMVKKFTSQLISGNIPCKYEVNDWRSMVSST
jgi:cyclin-dependent kinase